MITLHGVADNVVELARDPRSLLEDSVAGSGLPLTFQRISALNQFKGRGFPVEQEPSQSPDDGHEQIREGHEAPIRAVGRVEQAVHEGGTNRQDGGHRRRRDPRQPPLVASDRIDIDKDRRQKGEPGDPTAKTGPNQRDSGHRREYEQRLAPAPELDEGGGRRRRDCQSDRPHPVVEAVLREPDLLLCDRDQDDDQGSVPDLLPRERLADGAAHQVDNADGQSDQERLTTMTTRFTRVKGYPPTPQARRIFGDSPACAPEGDRSGLWN